MSKHSDKFEPDRLTETLKGRARARRKTRATLIDLQSEPRRRRNDLLPDLQIEHLAIGDIQVSPYRTRRTGPEQLARVTRSIETFGLAVPLLIDDAGAPIAATWCLRLRCGFGWTASPSSASRISVRPNGAFLRRR